MPHQHVVLDWAYPLDVVGFFLEMRLGKILVSTRWAQSKDPERVLILAPTPTIPDWLRELELEHQPVTYLEGSRRDRVRAARRTDGWFITNYEGVCIPLDDDRWVAPLITLKWDVMILDESTRIKNPTAKITTACVKKSYNTRCKAILSGYPAPEGPMDFYCQMAFLLDGVFMHCRNWWSFRHYNFNNIWGHEWAPKKGKLKEIKQEVRKHCYILSRKKAGVGSRKLYERRFVPMNRKQKQATKSIERDFMVQLASGKTLESKYVIQNCTWLARLAGGFDADGTKVVNTAKAQELLNLLTGELKGEQVVVWFRFNAELDWMDSWLGGVKGFKTGCIDGSVPISERKEVQGDFRRGRIQVLLCQVKTGKMGIDYSAADTAIYYSHSWSGEERNQSEDRIIHPKKKRPLLYIDLITEGSIDEQTLECTTDKSVVGKHMLRPIVKRRFKK